MEKQLLNTDLKDAEDELLRRLGVGLRTSWLPALTLRSLTPIFAGLFSLVWEVMCPSLRRCEGPHKPPLSLNKRVRGDT